MDTNDDQPPVSERLRSTAIPIAQLSPDVDRLQESSINSAVTLLWPFSSYARSLSVLLAETDFRLRRSNGQVKVTFHGKVAEEVAGTHIGIGDKVYLSLAGSRLVKNDAADQTPGKGVSWDVHFDASAFLEVWRDSKLLATVSTDRSSPPPPADHIPATPSTPATNGHINAPELLGSTSWQSPAFLGKSRMSFGFTDTALDPFVEDDGYVPGKGRKRPRFSMRNSEWRVLDEPQSPRDRDIPEDWMNIFDEELETGSDVGEEPVIQEAEARAISRSPEAVSETIPTADTDVIMGDVQPDTTGLGVTQPTNGVIEDTRFLRPNIAPRSVPESTILSGLDLSLHLPTDTPRLQPVPSPGLPDPSPICTTSNSPSGYFMAAVGAAAAALPTTPLVSVPEDVSELDHAATPPQVRSDGELTHVYEDDAVTVYTEDMQILPDSVLHSGEATSSPQIQDKKVAMNTTIVDDDVDVQEGERSDHSEEDAVGNAVEEAHDEMSKSEVKVKFEGEEDEWEDIISSPSKAEDERANDERLPERVDREDDESDGVSATWSEDEDVDAEVAERLKNDKPHLIESESLSPEESRDVSENLGYHYEDDEEDEVDEDNGDPEDQGEYEYEDNYEEEDERQEDRAGYRYDYSESEGDSEYGEAPRPQFTPKNMEPEVIVLDSDSEDEVSAQRPAGRTGREADDYSAKGSYDSEDGGQGEDELDLGNGGYYDEQKDEDDYDYDRQEEYEVEEDEEDVQEEVEEEAMEDELEEELEDNYGNREDEQAQMNEPPAYSGRAGSEHIDEDMHDEDISESHYQDVEEPLDTEMEVNFAEPPLEHDRGRALNGIQTSSEYLEDYQPVTDYSQLPAEHDPLDYLAAVSESAERIFTASEPTQHGYEMAIDPNLFALGTSQEADLAEPGPQDHPEAASEPPESKRQRALALQLDGAAPPAIDNESIEETAHMSIRHEALQLITPDLSQLVKVEEAFSPEEEPCGDMLPTPNLTQEAVTLDLETQSPLAPSEIKGPSAILESGSGSPVVPTKSEDEPYIIKYEEPEPAPPLVVVDSAAPTLLEDDQNLQASIEVDDAEEATDDTNISPIDRHYPGLRSKLSYFAPLATLIDHYNALVDTISIASEVRPATKATSGKKDFILTLQLTDQSMAGTTVYAQILRPYKPALPTPQEGDAILLRNFRVKSFDHSVILVSDSTSAWAVFPSSSEPQTNGPPVEFGDEEKNFSIDLRQWYLEDGLAMVADNQLQASVGRESRAVTPGSSIAPSDAGSIDLAVRDARGDTSSSGRGSRRRKSHRRITIHELRDGRRYTEVGSSPGEDSIHELRDGTVYANL
ncbi:hypothetical protein BDV12DRAFT_63877 [Aspergillus spectabilis]